MATAYRREYARLAAKEKVFADLVSEYGRPDPFVWFDGGRTGSSLFAAMLLHMVGQRISAVAAFTVYDRISEAVGGLPTPEGVLALGADRLRGLGLSPAKADYVTDLARHQAARTVDLQAMSGLDDDAVIDALTSVKGVGRWSAQAFLMRQLRRPDVLPAEDEGIRRAVRARWSLTHLPTVGEVRKMSADWSPYRSFASALLWKSLYPPGEASDPKERAVLRAKESSAPKR
ncbi:DNA-3-methyladenine glycosylase family protein [Streptomyces sp. NPDC093675]|uniref:DNA-3-methyladenine glycosylase family protein n=1 Tax=Streptomyces sp. NPDC093675 TaxID=3366049 RepID=UPI0038197A8C